MAEIKIIKEGNMGNCHRRFKEVLEDITQSNAMAIFYFHGEGWCPDCEPTKGALEDVATGYKGQIEIYSVYVGEKSEWKATVLGTDIRTSLFIAQQPGLQVVPSVALYEGLSEQKLAVRHFVVALCLNPLLDYAYNTMADLLDIGESISSCRSK